MIDTGMFRLSILPLFLVTLIAPYPAQEALAQCYYRQKDCSDAQKDETQRVKRYDKPVEKDPLGNALIGGSVTGVIKGSVAAGAASTGKAVVKDVATRKSQTTEGTSHTHAETCYEQWSDRQCGESKMSCSESRRIYDECKVRERSDQERMKRDQNARILMDKP